LPFDAVQLTVALVSPRTAVTLVGVVGIAAGVTGAVAVEAAEVPRPFVAVTVNVYAVPLVRPETVHVTAVVVVQPALAGVEVTV
jgi:hypothetical protein